MGIVPGRGHGEEKKKLTKPTEIKSHKVATSPDYPEYLVERAKTGAEAAHKREGQKKVAKKKGSR